MHPPAGRNVTLQRAALRVASAKYPPDPFRRRKSDDATNSYVGRPSISETVATLIVKRKIRKTDRILDVGCGRGKDLITLATWKFRDLHGLDFNQADIDIAKAEELRHLEKRQIDWKVGTLGHLRDYDAGEMDVVLDTLTLCNIRPKHHARYFRAIARIMRPGGLLVIQYRNAAPWTECPSRFELIDRWKIGFAEGEDGLLDRIGAAEVILLRRTVTPKSASRPAKPRKGARS